MKQSVVNLFTHAKLLTLALAFAIYVLLELSLNLLLIDVYSQPLQLVMGEQSNFVERLELFGRILSGFGISLAIVSFINPAAFNFGAEQQTKSISKQGKWIYRPLAFFIIWLLIVPFLRIAVEGVVQNTTNEKKLAAVRAIVYKEAYLANAVQIQGFPEFDEIASDADRKDLFVALIPSLAYFSSGFNKLIESNLENMGNHYLLNRQETAYLNEAVPKINQFDQVYSQELETYQKASAEYFSLINKEKNFSLVEEERLALMAKANAQVNAHWQGYIKGLKSVDGYNKQYSTDDTIRDVLREHRKRYKSSRCNSDCMDREKAKFAAYLNNITFKDGSNFGIYMTAEDVNLSKILKSADSLEFMFERGRKRLIQTAFDMNEESTYETYIASDKARQVAVKSIQDAGYQVADDWELDDSATLRRLIGEKYKGQAAKVWQTYQSNSRFSLESPGLGRIAFAKRPEVKTLAADILTDDYYLPSFTAGISTGEYQKIWLDQQDNISFIKMVTSTATTAAFSPGGAMFELGNDAVTLAIIPPVSIAASLLAILMLFLKISIYYWRKQKVYFAFALITGIALLLFPIASSITSKQSYNSMMARFADEFSSIDTFDKAFTIGFGYVLDAENGIYQRYRHLDLVDTVGDSLKSRNDSEAPKSAIRQLDDMLFTNLSFLSTMAGTGQVEKPFDANITVLKQDMNVGLYLGLRLTKDKISAVKIPNFFNHTELSLLAEQKLFFKPDWTALSVEYITNMDDPRYWIKLANGDLAKRSLIDELEEKTVAYLNQDAKNIKRISELVDKGKSNILLLQLERSDSYRCFVIQDIKTELILEAFKGTYDNYDELPNCKMKI